MHQQQKNACCNAFFNTFFKDLLKVKLQNKQGIVTYIWQNFTGDKKCDEIQ